MGQKTFVKQRHHFVWAHYLRNWSVEKNVYYVSPTGKISKANPNGLAVEQGFYKIHHLNADYVKYLSMWIEKSEPGLKKLHQDFLGDFILRSRVVKAASGLDNLDGLESAVAALEFNSLEDVHSNFESGARKIMDELSSGNWGAVKDDQNMLDLCCYLGHQITRTKSFREQSLRAIRNNMSGKVGQESYLALTEKNWWYVNFLVGLNAGWSFYSRRNQLNKIFLVNNTEIGFVTSDNPAINVHPSIECLAPGEAPVSMDLYFPISPKYALMMNDSNHYHRLAERVTSNDVEFLNAKDGLK